MYLTAYRATIRCGNPELGGNRDLATMPLSELSKAVFRFAISVSRSHIEVANPSIKRCL